MVKTQPEIIRIRRVKILLINIELIDKAINKMVCETLEQMEGKCLPTLTKAETIDKLGIISELVISISDEVNAMEGVSEELKYKVWELKKVSDLTIEKLLGA